MTTEESAQDMSAVPYEELYQQTLDLRRQLAELTARQRMVWALFINASRKLQISSASIKAAVSSLLNYDIFWDGANQHEFLTTINSSVDQAAKLASLLTLAVRSEAGSLEIKREPHDLREIISVVQDSGKISFPKLALDITLPEEGKPALVDYEYLTTALELVGEVFEARLPERIVGVQAIESTDRWFLDFTGLESDLIHLIQSSLAWQVDELLAGTSLPLDYLLRLYIVGQILRLQSIKVEVLTHPTGELTLRLHVPAAVEVVIGPTPKS
jgi:hypothetical protein